MPKSKSRGGYSAGFWVCVALSIGLVAVSWFAIVADRLSETGSVIRADTKKVVNELGSLSTVVNSTQKQTGEILGPVGQEFQAALERNRKQNEAMEAVRPFIKEQIK